MEKFAFVTDNGILGLYGINQIRNEDKAVFPMCRSEMKLTGGEVRLGRGQLVHARENDFWLVANGELQRYYFDLFGQKLNAIWQTPVAVGSPLHAGQLDETGKTIFIVSKDLARDVCLATAVDAESGTVIWQRQIGLECLGDPVVVGKEMVATDRGGSLLRLDGSKYKHAADREWLITESLLAGPQAVGGIAPVLLKDPKSGAVYQLLSPLLGRKLVVRRYQPAGEAPGGKATEATVEEKTLDLPAPLGGTPAIVADTLVIPLANGILYRFPFPLEGHGESGPDWRAPRADYGALGHVAAYKGDELIVTDGSRSLTHWSWPANGQFRKVPPQENPVPTPTREVSARIVAAPVVLPTDGNDDPKVCVADADNTLTLLFGPDLRTERTWSLGGKVTGGPFLRGKHIGCIVDRHRLVWIDPAKNGILWQYQARSDGIVGLPQVVDGLVVVADNSGQIVGLEVETG